jgi:glycerol-3-phosphate dehydrogenase
MFKTIYKNKYRTLAITAAGSAATLIYLNNRKSDHVVGMFSTAMADALPTMNESNFWAPPSRLEILNRLKGLDGNLNVMPEEDAEFDVLIIGGGATGAGCALDAATRGLKTALVERDDFACGIVLFEKKEPVLEVPNLSMEVSGT